MNEIALSDNLAQIELEINHHKQIAGQSIWEIGRRLNHVKEHDLAHGDFLNWLKSIEINQREAYRMMKVASEMPNLPTLANLGSTALYLIATLPDDEKQAQLDRIENGDNPTVRELQDVKRKLKLAEAENQKLFEEKEQQAEQLLNLKTQPRAEVKVIEKEVVKEVVPNDYQEIKALNETLLDEIKELEEARKQFEFELSSKQLELTELQLKSGKAVELAEKIDYLRGEETRLSNLIVAIDDLTTLSDEVSDFFDTKVAAIRFKPLINEVNAEFSVDKVKHIVNTIQSWCDDMYDILPNDNRKIIEGEIING